MALYLGSTKVGEMYLGSTKIGQAYLGSTLFYTSTQPPAPTVPAGTIELFAGTVIPSGYLLCDGAAVSRSTYATLFGVIGTKFGAGDGSSTFNLPDLGGRVPLGVSSTHLLGTTGGSETVTLTEAELPAHVHEVPQHGHADTIGATTPALSHTITQPVFKYNQPTKAGGHNFGGGSVWTTNTTTATATRNTDVAVSAHDAANCTMGGSITNKEAFNTESTGSTSYHNNMQPFCTFNYIICTGD